MLAFPAKQSCQATQGQDQHGDRLGDGRTDVVAEKVRIGLHSRLGRYLDAVVPSTGTHGEGGKLEEGAGEIIVHVQLDGVASRLPHQAVGVLKSGCD